jgi:hypothetical protein
MRRSSDRLPSVGLSKAGSPAHRKIHSDALCHEKVAFLLHSEVICITELVS